jgi:hypothetical protein
MWTTTAKKKDFLGDKVQRTPMEATGAAMTSFATSLEEDSVYGKTLLKAGAAQDKLGQEHLNFVRLVLAWYWFMHCLILGGK